MVKNNIDSLNDVGMLESGPDTELCCDFFLILFFCLACALWTELLDGVDMATILALDKTDGAASATSKDSAPLSVLFGEMGLGGIVERSDGVGMGCMGGRNGI